MSRKRLLLSLTAFFFGLALVFWLFNLNGFVNEIRTFRETPIDDSMNPVEAIAVLTGGSERLATGLRLLKAGKGRKMFISGVPAGLSLDDIMGKAPSDEALRTCCIVLGHAADSTIGNAEETYAWLKTEGFHSLRLVTANYHMPRSLLVFNRMLPDVVITPHPVVPESVKLDRWWMRPGTASLLITEYNKYLAASVRDCIRWHREQ